MDVLPMNTQEIIYSAKKVKKKVTGLPNKFVVTSQQLRSRCKALLHNTDADKRWQTPSS